MRVETALVAVWRDPEHDCPPNGTKIFMLTRGGTAVIGFWQTGMIAWSPLPKIPQSIKDKIV